MEASFWIEYSDYIIGIPTIILAIIVPLWIFFNQKKKKDLRYYVLNNYKLTGINNQNEDRLKVYFDDHPVYNPNIFIIKLKNTGNVPINKRDFETPIKLQFETEGKILTTEIIEKYPLDIEVEFKKNTDKIEITPGLLNKGDYFIFKFLFDEEVKDIRTSGRINGIKEVKKGDTKTGIRKSLIDFTLIMLIMLFFGIIIFLFFARMPGFLSFLFVALLPFIFLFLFVLLTILLKKRFENQDSEL